MARAVSQKFRTYFQCEFGACGSGFTGGSPGYKYVLKDLCDQIPGCGWAARLRALFHTEEGDVNPEWPGNGSLTPSFSVQDGVCSTGPFAPMMNGDPAILKCCQAHNDCYTQNRCNASSWIPLPDWLNGGACRSVCNATVVGCIINAK